MIMRKLVSFTVAAFLLGELRSTRFGREIEALLGQGQWAAELIERADLEDPHENALRARLLGQFRGYRENRDIFSGFPSELKWNRALISKNELKDVRYINWDYWLEISGGTRLPAETAARIRAGRLSDNETTNFLSVAADVTANKKFPEIIIVAENEAGPFVVLEGHVRLTGFVLAIASLPPTNEVTLGISENIRHWKLY